MPQRKKLYLNKCILGIGVFCNQYIRKDSIILITPYKIITNNENELLDQRYKDWNVGIDNKSFLCTLNFDNPEMDVYINHSCEENCILIFYEGKNILVNKRCVYKDEQLTIDYSSIEKEENWSMKCICGSSSCREIIYSNM